MSVGRRRHGFRPNWRSVSLSRKLRITNGIMTDPVINGKRHAHRRALRGTARARRMAGPRVRVSYRNGQLDDPSSYKGIACYLGYGIDVPTGVNLIADPCAASPGPT